MVNLLSNRTCGEKAYFYVNILFLHTTQGYFLFMEDKDHEIISQPTVDNFINGLLKILQHPSRPELYLKYNYSLDDYDLCLSHRHYLNIVTGQLQHIISFRVVVLVFKDLCSSTALSLLWNGCRGDVSMCIQALIIISPQHIGNYMRDPSS